MKKYFLILIIFIETNLILQEVKNCENFKNKNEINFFMDEKLNQHIIEEPKIILIYNGSLGNFNIIEIDQNFIITSISWTKKGDYIFNYLLGVFEGSNETSFMEGIPIGIIKPKGELEEINNIEINYPDTFKYIRYIPPNNNFTDISPIKIFGYEKNSNTFKNEKNFQVTNLPLISIHTENSLEPIFWGGYLNCKIKIINEGKIELNEKALIEVSGRTTGKIPPKKPYKIVFSTEQKIINFKNREKELYLLANFFDRSLLRNSLALKISQLVELKYTPRCLPVDVIFNGNFRGNYYICEKIEIGKNKINITKINNNDINEPNITGGYLLMIDNLLNYESGGYITKKGLRCAIIYPEEFEITPEQETFIKYNLNKLENEIYNGILDSIDLDSYSKFFIIKEFCGDPDHIYSSFYFYKERNDDKFYFGPVWDFDTAFDNDKRLIPTNNKTDFCFNYGESSGTSRELIKSLIGNKDVIEYIKKTWEKLCKFVLNEKILIDFIEEEKEKIKESGELNFLKWDNIEKGQGRYDYLKFDYGRSQEENFEVSIEILKDYIKKRFITFTNLINNAVLSYK